MPELKTYDLFISHVWRHDENSEYYKLIEFLEKANNFNWRNYSVPEDEPLKTKTDQDLEHALCKQIRPINCFIIISGMYAKYRKWIQRELEIAQYYKKPIVGIMPWGQERIPTEVQKAAKEMVGWNTKSIVDAVRNHSI